MTHWKHLVVALVAALALSACSSSSDNGDGSTMMDDPPAPSGPTDEELNEQRAGIQSAIMAARVAVAGLTDDASDAAINAARMAVAGAQAEVNESDIPDTEKAAFNTTIATLENNLGARIASIEEAREDAAEATMKANAELGEAMHAALGGPASDTTPATYALANIAALTLSADGLAIDAAAGAGSLADATDPASVPLEAGDSAGALGSWMGMDYALTTGTGDAMVTDEARVYTNQGAPDSEPFDEVYPLLDTEGNEGYIAVDGTAAAEVARVMAAPFVHSGTQSHPIPERSDALYVRGTYDGAPGEYRCTGTCTSTNDGKGSPSALGGTWHFKPGTGAMVSQPDANYLYYGWWVSKDSDGGPTAASAFVGEMGDVDGTGDTPSGADLTGSATYAGKAAGKFAMSNPLDGTGNGGHFTADAMLTANFGAIAGGSDNGVTGMIDNFRLNDGSDDPGWSVELNKSSAWAADGAITGPTSDATVWSIDGNKAPASGAWSGRMYDEMPGDAPDGDGSTVPTTVTGTFYSEFSTIGRMVGAFGADRSE